ncbi:MULTISPECIES: dTMP kinase [unclassified Nocardia]|uniref:dTMP kinase n=1 Tax=unclassified Nocardia TaxID=2637762 RepID=UPI001CE49EF8|nr:MULTISPECIES: dTMP kinase [unclassified Nocardia]
MSSHGCLVSIDGPNGVGKSAVVASLAEKLAKRKIPAFATAQPSSGLLGQVVRSVSETCGGVALALLVAGDRLAQQDSEIAPALARGEVVVTDRYLPSSLVLQVIDGVPVDRVWAFNDCVRVPDLAVILLADRSRIRDRLAKREQDGGRRSRFEHDPAITDREVELFDAAAMDLRRRGWPITVIDTSRLWPFQVANQIADLIEEMVTGRPAWTPAARKHTA